MTPDAHLDWFDDNIQWFSSIDETLLAEPVPRCPGWDVAGVLNHLAIGLGLAYPYAMAKPPDHEIVDAFDDVPWPADVPAGSAARAYFREEMGRCSEGFRSTDPAMPCLTYAGPGTAGFWFRRAAIETTLHRFDVADALGRHEDLPMDRGLDAVADAVEFALPVAAEILEVRPAAMSVTCSESGERLLLGTGASAAELSGPAASLLQALWGREDQAVVVTGDQAVAEEWLSLVERAFAGR